MLETNVIKTFTEKNLTLATAESCTGGLVAKMLTDVPGASKVFLGGVVSYTNGVKEKILHVKKETLDVFGAVSKETAREMADGVRLSLGADVGISVTGVAGPDKDDWGNDVGTVYIGVSTKKETSYIESHFVGSRWEIRQEAAEKIFTTLLKIVRK